MGLSFLSLILGGFGKIFKIISDFFKDNWKWAVPLLGAIALYFYVDYRIDKAYDNGYDQGIIFKTEEYRRKQEAEDKKNREFENLMRGLIEDFGVKAVEKAIERNKQETVYKETLREIIKDNPVYEQCVADPGAIEQRNSIRRLGPGEVVTAPIKGLDE